VPVVVKPPPVEFLADEFVCEDIDAYEVLPDEFVVEDESTVVFAGPSDAPPRPESAATAAAATPRPRRWVTRAVLSASLGVAALVASARLIGSSSPHPLPVAANSAVSSPSYELAANSAAANGTPETVVSVAPLATVASVAPLASDDLSSAEAGPPVTAEEYNEAVDTKQASQQALELGKVGLATSLGERSVALDPTDADSWLILGAAYIQAGDNKNARRCFSSCVKQATSGARRECVAMLR
jgi:Flp pilus assembly protein TadD